jgi:CheY-like chemotaxis protein
MTAVANSEVIKRLAVLIVESRPHSRALLRSMLLQLEVKKIHEVADGTAALNALVTFCPDVMILDWGLSVPSAPEVLRMARSADFNPNPDLPIIVLSSSGESASVHEAIGLGAPYFLVWPISPKMLQQRFLGIVADARSTALAQKRKHASAAPGNGAASESAQ